VHARLPVLAALVIASLALAAPASASIGPGPRLAFVEWLGEPPMTRLTTIAADSSGRQMLPVYGVMPAPFEGPAFSADGSTLVFSGYRLDAKGELRGDGVPRLFAVGAEGGQPRELAGTRGATRPVLSPDGRTVAFARSRFTDGYDPEQPLKFGLQLSATVWTIAFGGGEARRLTPWRTRLLNLPASFSPDGSTLLIERDRGSGQGPEVLARNLGGGPARVIARGAEDPAFSPDGTKIALVSSRETPRVASGGRLEPIAELYVVNADGSGPRRLTRTRRSQESQPSWSPNGARIAFLRTPGPGGLGFGSELMQVNADGSCARRVTGSRGRSAPVLYGPAWQPGAGREATLLRC
jgi:Tol biopolymer transport system component